MNGGRKLSLARLGTVEYQPALRLQEAIVRARLDNRIADTLLMLEHPHVFTLGRGGDDRFLIDRPEMVPIHRVSRGGQITYHGPGQLIGYPILKLEGAGRDIALYLRKLEAAMIDALGRIGIAANRRDGLTGVWVGDRKIASIGVGLRRWVTYHGMALNVASDLRFFDAIVPCGIAGCQMTSIAALGYPGVSQVHFARIMEESFASRFGYDFIEPADPAALWDLIDAPTSACEAQPEHR
ncbi:MAG: lipoyl(octanoyl) transferase LipB [Candidatus Binataceae bacterium]|nr:lipoyl(octanoyl) transferase LipB [Candidatus Binataceae bacterium]